MRRLRRAVTALLVLALVLLALELAAPPWITSRIDAAVHDGTDGTVTVESRLAGFPVLTRLAATGTLGPLELEVTEVAGRPVPVDAFSLRLDRVALDRRSLLTGDVQVTDLGPGAVTIRESLPGPALQALRAAGAATDVTRTEDGLRIDLPVVPAIDIPLPSGLLPCTPRPEIGDTSVVLRCAFTRAPELLQQIVNRS